MLAELPTEHPARVAYFSAASEASDSLSMTRLLPENHREYQYFRTTSSPRDDVELWFDQEFKQAWRR